MNLKNFMYKNKIQRSQIVLATKKNNPISALVTYRRILLNIFFLPIVMTLSI